ncbi:MAG TPA: c-type cytochrome [Actinomycetota bacterium]|jgi:ubiquinol-cytochrome c reductase cytochrome c subunit
MSTRTEAATLSRILRWGLLIAVVGQVLWSFRPAPSRAQTVQERTGQRLYEASCSTCHGLTGDGTGNGPTLQGVSPSAVEFMLTTGRMPLASPNEQPRRQDPRFSPEEIDAIVAYVQTIAPGGVPIPPVDPAAGSLSEGAAVFLDNCAGCHGAGATGDSIGGGRIAPSLDQPTAQEIAEAVRIGPGTMPVFNPRSLSEQELNSLVRYLLWLREDGGDGGLQLGRVGAVAEGLVAGVIGLGLLIVAIRLTGSKT